MKYLFAILLACTTLSAEEAIEVAINERSALSISLSSTLHNRIAVIDGSVETLIANPHYFNVDIMSKLGQAVITVLRPLESPQLLSVVTSSGLVQDFLVTASEKEPAVIFLKEPEEIEEIALQHSLANIETLSEILDGKIPHGYGKRSFLPHDSIEVGNLNDHIQHVGVFEGALENIYVLDIRNNSVSVLIVDKERIKTSEINWVFSTKSELEEDEVTTLLISKRRE